MGTIAHGTIALPADLGGPSSRFSPEELPRCDEAALLA